MDHLQRFFFARSGIRGHWVDLTDTLTELAARRAYPQPVLTLLGEMLAVVGMVADGSKWPGSIALQAKLPGNLHTTMAEYRPQGNLRAIARIREPAEPVSPDLSQGQLTLSMLPSPDQPNSAPYQGIVELRSGNLAANLDRYFAISEQIPTRFFLAADGRRALGLLLQRLPNDAADAWSDAAEEAAWTQVNQQLDKLIPENILSSASPTLLTDLLQQGFPADSIEVADAKPVAFACTCTRDRSTRALRTMSPEDLMDLLAEQGQIEVTCEFCGKDYAFTALDTHALLDSDHNSTSH